MVDNDLPIEKDDDDDELDIVEVAEIPKEPPAPKPEDEDDAPPYIDEGGDDDEEDTRLADDDHEDDDAGDDAKKRRRVKRREVQRLAKERTLQENAALRRRVEEQDRRLAALEGTTTATSVAQIDQRLNEVDRDIRTADMILAKALEAGNGADFVEAQRLRDEAVAAKHDLTRQKTAVTTRQDQPKAVDPVAVTYAQQWRAQNAWYDPAGSNDASAVANAIDNRLTAEGYDPGSQLYWTELTKRLNAQWAPPKTNGKEPPVREKRKAPPQGGTAEHAPASTRREVHVTPDRKKAMQDAGVWDDPVERTRMLKAYDKYDRENRSAG